MANELEDALQGMGLSFADSPDQFEEKTEETPVAEEQPQEEVTEEPVTETEPQESESSLQEEITEEPQLEMTEEPTEETTISEGYDDEQILSALSEKLGTEFSSFDDLTGLLDKQQTLELDPAVQAIADFVSQTGRSVEDWFTYQSFNPSEMDDLTVMKTAIKNEYPDMSEEEAQLLLDSRYKINEDEYSESDVKLGQLNLKMDAKKAREELNMLRESYKAPARQEMTAENQEIESPITEEWIGTMSQTVDAIEALEIELGKDKTFSYGIDDSYKQTLKSKNAKLDEFFDPYVDDNGNWDFDTLSAHRTIIDNIDSIAKAIYAQGLSDGQSEVVKQTVNPSAPNAKGAAVDAPSAQDKVRQQVLDALRGGDDKMRFKF
jgi:hypothetical protein